jgi:hypothetical protein
MEKKNCKAAFAVPLAVARIRHESVVRSYFLRIVLVGGRVMYRKEFVQNCIISKLVLLF